MSEKAKKVLQKITETTFLANDLRRVIYDTAASLGYTIEEEKQVAEEIINFIKEQT